MGRIAVMKSFAWALLLALLALVYGAAMVMGLAGH
jgi:hypothetical protein